MTEASAEARMELRLEKIEWLARDCRAFEFRALDGAALPPARAGAHIGVHLPNGILRQYSLLEAGDALRSYRIGVKRDPASRGGSAFMFDRLQVGNALSVDLPRNNFPLDGQAGHSVLFAGGIGITPIWCMMRELEASGRVWTMHYAARSREEAPFASVLESDSRVHLHFDDEQGGVLPIASAIERAPAGAHFYCCGPAPMLEAFEQEARAAGIAAERVHVEYFTQRFEADRAGGYAVSLARSGIELQIGPGQSILGAVLAAGVDVPFSCEDGICGACETRVLSGEVDHRDSILSDQERAANATMFICCSGARGDRLVLDL